MTKSARAALIAVSSVLILAGVLAVLSPERQRLTDAVRRDSGRDFIELSEGWTEFEVAGPADGEKVILIHGFSVAAYDWDNQFRAFADAGYRVLRYCHYARGLSDRPRGAYDSERYVHQLKDLMDTMGWERAHLVAHSMGGAVTAEFVSACPDRTDRVVLVAPTLHMADDNPGVSLVRVPVAGDLAAPAALTGIITRRAEELFEVSKVTDPSAYLDEFEMQTRYFGFVRSVRSLFRHDLVDDRTDSYRNLDGSRTLLIWGTQDDSVPRDHIERIAEVVPGMRTVFLEGAHHSPNLEVPEEVNTLILDFLTG